ncbi:futalosine hydrolase, partial [Clostridium perfringens]|nr:futalosine hydrolase [Clostridium perfringens]
MNRVRNDADHASHARNGRVLVVTSVAAARDAVLGGGRGEARLDVLSGGGGAAAGGISTAKALTQADTEYGLVVCAGIAGGFTERAAVGSVVVASEMLAADLGAETPDGFLSVDE